MKFTGEEVRDLVYGDSEKGSVVDTTEGENRRWSRTNIAIVEVSGKFYQLYWEQGLTESQENDFEDQDGPEVKKVSRAVIVNNWVVWSPGRRYRTAWQNRR